MNTLVVISRDGEADAQRRGKEDRVAAWCATAGAATYVMPPLYHLPDDSPLWAELAAWPGRVLLFTWLYARPGEWLLRAHGVEQPEVCHLEEVAGPADIQPMIGTPEAPGVVQDHSAVPTRPRWYPIIDGSRCVNCHHCLQFCLFSVYAPEAGGQVRVQQSDACKPGCPACSRVCPQGAIMFPLYEKDDAIAGAPGCFITPDPSARRMYYRRTGQPCPSCGQTGMDFPPRSASGAVCAECGRQLPTEHPTDVDTEIDDLIRALDHLCERRS